MIQHSRPIKWLKQKKTDQTRCGQRCGGAGSLTCGWWECKMAQHLEMVWQFLFFFNFFYFWLCWVFVAA